MAKFKVTVVRTDEYEIEVDENIWTECEIKEWGNTFWGGSSLRDVASALGIAWMKEGRAFFKEGFGYVRELDSNGNPNSIPYKDESGNYSNMPDEKYAKGLSIKPISEDEDYEINALRIS